MYEQGEIVLIPFPYTDLTGVKKRPSIIISNSLINKTQDRICALITSNPNKEGILIEPGDFEKGKLPFKSWVKPQRIFTINEKIIIKSLCKMNSKFHNKIISKINNYIREE